MNRPFISYNELKKHVSLMDVATTLGYQLDIKQGKKFPVMVKTDGSGHKIDSIVICNPGNNERMGYFRHAGGKGNTIDFITENKNELAQYGNSVYKIMVHFANGAKPEASTQQQWVNENNKTKPFSLNDYSIETLKGREFLMAPLFRSRNISLDTVAVFSDNLMKISHWQPSKREGQDRWMAENLGFPYRIPGNQEIVGLELRGFKFKRKAAGSNSTDAVWSIDFTNGNPDQVRAVYFAESPYDLMAMYQQRKSSIRLEQSAFVATGGAFSNKQIVNAMNHYKYAKAYDCFDNDLAGRIYGIRMQMLLENRNFAVVRNGKKHDFIIDNNIQFSIDNDKVSLQEFRKDVATQNSVVSLKPPKEYKDWNDVILGKRLDGQPVEENGLKKHNDDNYNARMEAFKANRR